MFEMSVLRRILGVSRSDRRRNEDIRMLLAWSIQECGGRNMTSPIDVLWSCLQVGSSSVPLHYSVWENPRLQTRWQAKEEMVGRCEDRLCRVGTVYVPSCSLSSGSCSLEKDVGRAAEAHSGVAKALSSSKFKFKDMSMYVRNNKRKTNYYI